MKFLQAVASIFILLKNTNNNTKNRHPKLQGNSTLLKLYEAKKFYHFVSSHVMLDSNRKMTNFLLIRKLIRCFAYYFIAVLIFSFLSLSCLLTQPFVNSYLKKIIQRKDQQGNISLLIELVLIFFFYKILNSLLYLISDFLNMIFGVKIYSTVAYNLIQNVKEQTINNQFIAIIQDDCQRLIRLPTSLINSIIKITEFIIFSSILLAKLQNYKITIGLIYWSFLIVSIVNAVFSSFINLKIMSSKQKRIKFNGKVSDILQQRQKQIDQIRNLMILDCIGFVLPWLLNVTLIIILYGFVGIPKQDKYFVLTIFQLLRSSISGLGVNFNFFSQAWSSLYRISKFINSSSLNSSSQFQVKQNYQTKFEQKKVRNQDKSFRIKKILQLCSNNIRGFKYILVILIVIVFIANFMYAFCAKSILVGQTIFSLFNIVTLCLQLISPMALFSFICYCNLKLSRSVYKRIFKDSEKSKDESDGLNNFISSDSLNRLSGDIRLLDRQLYSCSYGVISHITGITATFTYSCVILANVTSLVIVFFFILSMGLLTYFCSKFMRIRKQVYRKQATNKGFMLSKLRLSLNPIYKWMNIYTNKYLGFNVQIMFLAVLYFIMILLCSIVIAMIMLSRGVSVEQTLVIFILVVGLDSQYLILFIQVILLETSTAGVIRCFNLLDSLDYGANKTKYMIQNQDKILTNQ